jgi:beta-hydroxylase
MEVVGSLLSPRALPLVVLVVAATAIQLRGQARLSIRRQITDLSTFTAPYNLFLYLASRVPNQPYLDAGEFPELAVLARQWEVFRDEARALYAAGHIRQAEGRDDVYGNSLFKRGWKRFYVKWYGEPLASARRLCPRSVAILESLPGVHAAMFSFVAPRSQLGKHRDPLAASLRYHLGLITPNSERCRILVDGVPYAWRDGEGVLFDESYVHWVENDTDEIRIVLFCDVERPLRWPMATAVNRWVMRHLGPMTAARNEAGEPLGVANSLAAAYYPMQAALRRFKAAHRRVYYTLKFALLTALVAAVAFV